MSTVGQNVRTIQQRQARLFVTVAAAHAIRIANLIYEFPAAETNLLWPTVKLATGKGGAKFSDFAALCASVGGARIVVTLNAFTDDADSAGAFAAYALSNHIAVAAWELCNEPYTFAGTDAGDFFLSSTDYVARVKPYRNAIKAADPNAVVAIYFSDAGYPEPNDWDSPLSHYADKYWDAVVYHHYPALPASVPFADLMAMDNWELASNTTSRMLNYLIPDNLSNVTFFISEFAPARGNGTGAQSPPTTTLYGGVYAAEYLLRMSTLPVDTNSAGGPKITGTIPALYAQAYQGGNGRRYVVLTNKGSNAVPVQITEDGAGLTNQFLETFVSGSDPQATNTAPQSSPVQIQTATATNPVTIPEYSVVRLEWTVANVAPPVLSAAFTNGQPALRWSGLTNVVYDVQAATNLLNATWPTVGKVPGTQTNFEYTDPTPNPRRFYRLAVP